MTGRLLTARLVAERLDVSCETVLRWVRRGELPAIRLPGGAIRIGEAQLDEWLDNRATPGPGVLATQTDAAREGSYMQPSTDADSGRRGLGSLLLAAPPRTTAASEDQE